MTKKMFGQLRIQKNCFTQRKSQQQIYFLQKTTSFGLSKNYNHFVNYYKDTYQHGGISLEEIIIPISILEPK